mmetsp:Transcript_28985/g.53099  ORF Transcript_28985/g.53099 Transcript_28985/m.53099 type:complete len:82 (+) Transcript_28985:386-631(+)
MVRCVPEDSGCMQLDFLNPLLLVGWTAQESELYLDSRYKFSQSVRIVKLTQFVNQLLTSHWNSTGFLHCAFEIGNGPMWTC